MKIKDLCIKRVNEKSKARLQLSFTYYNYIFGRDEVISMNILMMSVYFESILGDLIGIIRCPTSFFVSTKGMSYTNRETVHIIISL